MTQRNLEQDTHNELGAALRNGRVLALILVCLAVVFVFGYAQRAATLAEVQAQLHNMEAQMEAANFRTAELQAELRYVASEEFLDKVAREELGLVKPGEIALILIGPPTPIVPVNGASPDAAAQDTPAAPAAVLRAAQSTDAATLVSRSGSNLSTPEPSVWQAWLELFANPFRP